jgi:hypothetical protein
MSGKWRRLQHFINFVKSKLMAKDDTLLIVGAVAVVGYFYLKGQGNPVVAPVTSLINSTLAPITSLITAPVTSPVAIVSATPVIPNAPQLVPLTWNAAYYQQYQYPALVALNPQIQNSSYQLTSTDAVNYLNNYLELHEWLATGVVDGKRFKTQQQALQWHWTTYGVPYQYSFVPFVPPKNVNWVPPPPNPKASTSVFGTILRITTVVAGATLEIASAGTLTPIVAPATGAALAVEGTIHGVPNDALNAEEIDIIVMSAAIIKKILPFYLISQSTRVNSIANKIDFLLTTYE